MPKAKPRYKEKKEVTVTSWQLQTSFAKVLHPRYEFKEKKIIKLRNAKTSREKSWHWGLLKIAPYATLWEWNRPIHSIFCVGSFRSCLWLDLKFFNLAKTYSPPRPFDSCSSCVKCFRFQSLWQPKKKTSSFIKEK